MKKIVSLVAMIIIMFGFCSSTLAGVNELNSNDMDGLPARMDDYISKRKKYTASVAVSVVNHGKVEKQEYFGHANIEKNIPADKDTVYEWGSTSKLLVWASVMQLYEQRKIDLNKNIEHYLPEKFLSKLKYDEPITMLNLMNHNAGFQELVFGDHETQDKEEIVELEEALKTSEPSQIYRPGEVCSYSNWGTALAAYIVEQITKERFYDYVKKNIFIPLNMNSSTIRPDFSDNSKVAKKRNELHSYSIYQGGKESYGKSIVYLQLYPAGSAVSTLEDYTKFLMALIPDEQGKSPLFKKKETYSKMISPSLNYENADYQRISHRLWYLPYGNGIIGHSGNTQACTSSLYFDPEKKLGIAIMTNEVGETSYNFGLLSVVFGDYTKGAKNEYSASKNLTGIYTSSRINMAHGIYKINKYLSPAWWKKENDRKYKFASIMKMQQIDDNVFLTNNGDGLHTLNVVQTKKEKIAGLQTFTQDEKKESNIGFALSVFLFILFIVMVLFSLFRIPFMLVKHLYFKISRKKQKKNSTRLHSIIENICVVIVGLLVFWLILLPGSIYHTGTAIKSIGLSVITLYLFYILVKRMRQRKRIRLNIYDYFMVVSTIVIIINVLWWEWFNFWSY